MELYAQQPIDADTIPINHIQSIGSHNSYRKPMDPGVIRNLRFVGVFIKKPKPYQQLQYEHVPFEQQFADFGVRGLEIDVHHDPEGGRYYRQRRKIIGTKRTPKSDSVMLQPGLKVFHISDVDVNTHHLTFKQVLMAVKDWSKAHPRHLPIYILVEPKEEGAGNHVNAFGLKPVLPFDSVALMHADQEIREVFTDDLDHILKPDDVRGDHRSLKEAIQTKGWPLLREARGKLVFIINGDRHHTELYASGHPSFRGRMMFSFSHPDRDDAAFIKRDNAFSTDIPELVRQGFMVRTRTDSPGDEAFSNDTTRRESAFRSGAQLLSTDYYRPDLKLSPYEVQFEGKAVGRLNFLSEFREGPVQWE